MELHVHKIGDLGDLAAHLTGGCRGASNGAGQKPNAQAGKQSATISIPIEAISNLAHHCRSRAVTRTSGPSALATAEAVDMLMRFTGLNTAAAREIIAACAPKAPVDPVVEAIKRWA